MPSYCHLLEMCTSIQGLHAQAKGKSLNIIQIRIVQSFELTRRMVLLL